MRVTLIHNPNAGENDHAGEALRSLVAVAGHDIGSYSSMKQAGWEEALADPGDLVVVAGGDGSVGKVFREVARTDVSAPKIARASWRISRTSPRFELALPELPRRRGKLILLGPPVESRLHVDERLWPDDPDERATARPGSPALRAERPGLPQHPGSDPAHAPAGGCGRRQDHALPRHRGERRRRHGCAVRADRGRHVE